MGLGIRNAAISATAVILPLVTTFEGSRGFQGGASPWSLTLTPIGTANANRRVYVAIHAPSTSTALTNVVSAVTINGVGATLLTGGSGGARAYPANQFHELSIWWADVPSGTGNVTVGITSAARSSMNIAAVWTLDKTRLLSDSYSAIASDGTSSGNPLSAGLIVPNGGSILALCGRQAGSGTFIWGGTGITERSDNPLATDQATNSVSSSASGDYTVGASVTVTATPSATSVTEVLMAVAIR